VDDNSAQPPFGHCTDVSSDPNACIGDDTIHTVMHSAYTWPNDPQTYAGDAPTYRIIFSPGGNPVPISPTATIPLCSDLTALPAIYGYADQYHGPDACTPTTKCGKCDVPVNKEGAVFAVAHTKPEDWACSLSAGDPTHVPPILPGAGDEGVICRWHAASPTPTPTATPTGTPTATPTGTGVPTPTPTGTGAPTPTATPTATATATATPTSTTTPTPTATPTPSGRVNARLDAKPAPYYFGFVPVGQTKLKVITLTNEAPKKGGATITILGITLSSPSPFFQFNNCPSSLAPRQTCQITTTFAPTAVGPAQAFLMMNDNARNGQVRDSLTGTGQ